MAHYDEKDIREGSPTSEERYEPWNEHLSPGRYAATRITTLKPPMAKAPNPLKLLAMLNFQQWMFL
jgi:MFS transporter, SHS family, lactate transporter